MADPAGDLVRPPRRAPSWNILHAEPVRLWRARRAPLLAAEVSGRGKAVVLLHGQPGSAADWAAVAALLSPEHTVVVPDRPGYGATGGRAVGFAGNAAALARLLRSLQLPSAVFVGHSWAGGAALKMATDFPAMVDGLVLVAPVSPQDGLGRLDRLLARRFLGTALAAVTLSTAGSFLAWGPGRALARRKLTGRPRDQLAQTARALRRPATWSSFATEQRALLHELPRMATDLGHISVPTVVVTGTADRVVAPASSRRLARSISGALLYEVPGGGHLLPQSQPAEVARAVRRLT